MTGLSLDGAGFAVRGTTILAGIDARFARGQVTVLIGPNGAGKSTALRLLAGLEVPSEGAATLDDADVAALPPARRARAIGYLPQGPEVHWNLAVRDLVALGRATRRGQFGALTDADEAAVEAALAETDTARFAERDIASLSGGERARVLLARVLAGEPDWVLADEPLAHLDPAHQIAMLRLFRRIAARGAGVALVLHDLGLAAAIADRVLLLDQGRIAGDGGPEVLTEPGLVERVYGVAIERIARADGTFLIGPRAERLR